MQEALNENRLLIVSVSVSVRQSKITALERNKYICDIADKILLVDVTEQSSLYELQQIAVTSRNFLPCKKIYTHILIINEYIFLWHFALFFTHLYLCSIV